MEKKKCVVCGFDKGVEKHHIIKRRDMGSDESDNIVLLCPNHHWVADFGEEEDRLGILNLITEITGKTGLKLSEKEQQILDLKIRVLHESSLGNAVWDKSFWEDFKKSSNYLTQRTWLLGRDCPSELSRELNIKSDKLILIRKLKETL